MLKLKRACATVGFGLLRALAEEDRREEGGHLYSPSSPPPRSPQNDYILHTSSLVRAYQRALSVSGFKHPSRSLTSLSLQVIIKPQLFMDFHFTLYTFVNSSIIIKLLKSLSLMCHLFLPDLTNTVFIL